MLWNIRCAIAYIFRILGMAFSVFLVIVLTKLSFEYPEEFAAVFQFPLLEIGGVAFGGFGLFELAGRLLSWTKPEWRLPKFNRS